MYGSRVPRHRDTSGGVGGDGGCLRRRRRRRQRGGGRTIFLVIFVKVFTSDALAMTRARDFRLVTLAIVFQTSAFSEVFF